ncbi:hypothetical protein N7466_009760 [Penicillium verhagenii]|uniref:uncharacterized protein n=1 Tax=Penicillium verhagenii TaxID=1562060 RepID=UPI002544E8D3|nr:uncharacterized protein N7466_009760 [Penicillium verhagenii]KAJ5921434.1 hypothetical protein N7466_009760 [Penicillium verhagenii]
MNETNNLERLSEPKNTKTPRIPSSFSRLRFSSSAGPLNTPKTPIAAHQRTAANFLKLFNDDTDNAYTTFVRQSNALLCLNGKTQNLEQELEQAPSTQEFDGVYADLSDTEADLDDALLMKEHAKSWVAGTPRQLDSLLGYLAHITPQDQQVLLRMLGSPDRSSSVLNKDILRLHHYRVAVTL